MQSSPLCAAPTPGALLLAALVLAATPAAAASDPLEGLNRRIHGFNRLAQQWVMTPVAHAYLAHTSPGFRAGMGNAFANLREPITAISSLATGDLGRAWNAAARFGINSSLGYGGVTDRAAEWGWPRREMQPADAACAWGMPSGPYVVLPLLGPSTLRDAGVTMLGNAGLAQVLGPAVFLPWRGGEIVVGYSAVVGEIGRVEAGSLDPYAVYRSAYLQRRAAICPADGLPEDAGEDAAEPTD